MTRSNVLISKVGGGTDYATDGDVNVVFIDFDSLDGAFPDKLDELIMQVRELPRTMPWRTDFINELESRRVHAMANLLTSSEHVSLDLHPEMLSETG